MIFQESETVELKASVTDDIKKEIVAFANCEGGTVYIGIQDNGTVSATDTAIRRMIKETDGDHFEDMRSTEQNLSFEAAGKEFSDRNLKLEQAQMKTLGIMTQDGVYTNLGLLLSDQCVHTIKAAVF